MLSDIGWVITIITVLSDEQQKGTFFDHAMDLIDVLRTNTPTLIKEEPELAAQIHDKLQSFASTKLKYHLFR